MSQYLDIFAAEAGASATLEAYEEVVRTWPVPFVEFDVPTSNGLTHVIASGPEDAEPVILLHAYFATSASWYRVVDALSARYRTYAVDLLGDVGKSRPIRPMASLDDFTQWFAELTDAIAASPVHLIGNSVGGFLAAAFAMRCGERVRSLTLIGPAATVHPMPAFYRHMFVPKMVHVLAPWMPGRERSVNRAVDWMNAGLPGEGPWDALFRLSLMHGTGANRVFPRVYSQEELSQIAAPTLLIVGDHERIYPPEGAVEAATRLMPGIVTEIIPNAHHIAAIAQPELVSRRILQFLETTMKDGRAEPEADSSPAQHAHPADCGAREVDSG